MADNPDAIKREMYRTSLDKIRVYNPTKSDFTILWEKFRHTVPNKDKDVGYGKGQKVMERYLAVKWCRDMKNKILGEEAEILVQDMIDRASEDMKLKYKNDPLLRQELYNKTPTINDEKAVERVYEIIWLGVEEQYGIEDGEEVKNDGNIDQRPVEERILDKMNRPAKKAPQEQEKASESVYPITKNKKKLIDEVSQ